MTQTDKDLQGVVVSLYEDERLRSNLSDDEAKIVLTWAERWVTAQANAVPDEMMAKQVVQAESVRVRQVLSALNAYARTPGAWQLSAALAALATSLDAGKPLTRGEILTLLTDLLSATWQARRGSR